MNSENESLTDNTNATQDISSVPKTSTRHAKNSTIIKLIIISVFVLILGYVGRSFLPNMLSNTSILPVLLIGIILIVILLKYKNNKIATENIIILMAFSVLFYLFFVLPLTTDINKGDGGFIYIPIMPIILVSIVILIRAFIKSAFLDKDVSENIRVIRVALVLVGLGSILFDVLFLS